ATGCAAASCGEHVALQHAAEAARASEARIHDPAASIAGRQTAKAPAPIIDPSPIAIASASPSLRARPVVMFRERSGRQYPFRSRRARVHLAFAWQAVQHIG